MAGLPRRAAGAAVSVSRLGSATYPPRGHLIVTLVLTGGIRAAESLTAAAPERTMKVELRTTKGADIRLRPLCAERADPMEMPEERTADD
jgi:hypothetical protein